MGAAEETADFAELLRELKQRSGLSYEALAKRAHLSASTLHRYCVGEGVPADYASVSRFARVCRATPEEMVELHRRWVIADAARERARRAAAGSASAAVDQDGAAAGGNGSAADGDGSAAHQGSTAVSGTPLSGAAASGAAVEQGRTASVAGDTAAVPGDGDTAAERDGVDEGPGGVAAGQGGVVGGAEADGVPASGTASEIRSTPAYDDLSGAASGVPSEAEVLTERPDGLRSTPRKRWALVAASAVTVAALSTAIVVSMNSGEGPGGGKAASTVSASGEVSDAPAARDRPTPSSTSSKSPSPRPGRSRESGTSDANPPAAGNGGAGASSDDARKDSGVPLTVSADAHAWVSPPCGVNYLINRPPDKVPAPPPQQDASSWARAFGAVAAGEQRITLTLQGKGDETVVVDSVHVRVVRSGEPLAWNAYDMATGCGGKVSTTPLETDLDARQPVIVAKSGERDVSLSVSRSDPEKLSITARTDAHDVEWYVELQWSSGGRRGTVQVKDNGRPFRTSGMKGRPQYNYPLGYDSWQQPLPES